MNEVEQEAIILASAWDMIEGLVNWEMFVKTDNPEPSNLLFQRSANSHLFVILLADFLSEIKAFKGEAIPLGLAAVPSGARPSDLTFLFHLRRVCDGPTLGSNTEELRRGVEAFAAWLEGEFTTRGVNLSDIDVVADVTICRLRYIRMCGDIAKHSLARLATNAKHLRKILASSGQKISEQQSYLALDGFYEWFHTDIFMYHSSQIAEFLNNIRWAIYRYLRPEFSRSYHLTGKVFADLKMWSYHVPEAVSDPLARAMYWSLMNRSLSPPYVPEFRIPDIFKQRY